MTAIGSTRGVFPASSNFPQCLLTTSLRTPLRVCCPNKTELTNVTPRSGIPGLRMGYCPQSYGAGSFQGPGLAAFLFGQQTLKAAPPHARPRRHIGTQSEAGDLSPAHLWKLINPLREVGIRGNYHHVHQESKVCVLNLFGNP